MAFRRDYDMDGISTSSNKFRRRHSISLTAIWAARRSKTQLSRGLASTRNISLGLRFFDFDNDGWPDIPCTANVYPESTAHHGSRYVSANSLSQSTQGHFEDVSLTPAPGFPPNRCSWLCFGRLTTMAYLDFCRYTASNAPRRNRPVRHPAKTMGQRFAPSARNPTAVVSALASPA